MPLDRISYTSFPQPTSLVSWWSEPCTIGTRTAPAQEKERIPGRVQSRKVKRTAIRTGPLEELPTAGESCLFRPGGFIREDDDSGGPGQGSQRLTNNAVRITYMYIQLG